MPLPPSSSSAWQARQSLGARLSEIRKDAGLTGRKLAHLCEWHESMDSPQVPLVLGHGGLEVTLGFLVGDLGQEPGLRAAGGGRRIPR